MSRAMHSAAAMEYPYSDGRPMVESEAQLSVMLYVVPALKWYFRNCPDVYVGADMFMYYEEGNPAAVVAPDVFVVLGAPKRADAPRLSYKLWEEPKGPDFVLEVLSRSTRAADLGEKRALYASLGVEEYWLYDPTGEQLPSRLRGMGLDGDRYRPLAPSTEALRGRRLQSAVLGVDVRVLQDGALRMSDSVTGQDLLTYDEEHDGRRAAEVRAAEEAEARRAESAARKTAETRARRESAAREAAETRARRESAAREAADARVAELEALLRKSGGPYPR